MGQGLRDHRSRRVPVRRSGGAPGGRRRRLVHRMGRPGAGRRAARRRQLDRDYELRNVSDEPVTVGSLAISTPWRDVYVSSRDSLRRAVHAHVWTGGADSWVWAVPMDGSGPGLGLRAHRRRAVVVLGGVARRVHRQQRPRTPLPARNRPRPVSARDGRAAGDRPGARCGLPAGLAAALVRPTWPTSTPIGRRRWSTPTALAAEIGRVDAAAGRGRRPRVGPTPITSAASPACATSTATGGRPPVADRPAVPPAAAGARRAPGAVRPGPAARRRAGGQPAGSPSCPTTTDAG